MLKAKHVIVASSFAFLCGNLAAGEPRPATVLLITSQELQSAWEDFADWKTRLGKATKIVTVEAIEEEYTGDDVQQKIRVCVLEHIEKHSTRWVILGGDSQPGGRGIVPDRDTPHVVMGRMRFPDIPTDVYYLSEKNWDANGDGVYGDWKNDRAAIAYTNPKASIGRIPVRTADNVAAYIEKVIGYESRYPGDGFAASLVYTCPEPQAFPKLIRSWDDHVGPNWTGGKVVRFFSTRTPWDETSPGDYDLSPDHWVKMFNDRTAGKLHMHGHGFLPVWVLENRQTVDGRHVAKLTNRDAYAIITTVSCFTGHYDAATDPSITETMLRAPRRGAVALVAPSRPGVPIFHKPSDMRLMMTEGKLDGTTQTMTRFWQHGLKENLTTGEAFSAAKAAMTEDAMKTAGYHFCQCELNLLGDPTLGFRTADPTTPGLSIPKKLAPGEQTVTVKTDTPGATVCLWKGDEVYEVARAGDDGDVAVSVHLKTPGKLLVTVSGPNLNAVTESIAIE